MAWMVWSVCVAWMEGSMCDMRDYYYTLDLEVYVMATLSYSQHVLTVMFQCGVAVLPSTHLAR